MLEKLLGSDYEFHKLSSVSCGSKASSVFSAFAVLFRYVPLVLPYIQSVTWVVVCA